MKLDVAIRLYGMYTNERGLRVRVYVDGEWLHVRRETLRTSKIFIAVRAGGAGLCRRGARRSEGGKINLTSHVIVMDEVILARAVGEEILYSVKTATNYHYHH